ncbi:hypothetical protein PC128_g10581 [Phytophthora cactorum]|nr:hypothetical protein PC121_g7108 [Phytophthora cactorum]KAG3192371.1 hypothetical protein PC128_g10581 [Phytophthora cactorum]KAG4056397.1 hypothetical protein PC123_g8550 [Phytophthora cactorum]
MVTVIALRAAGAILCISHFTAQSAVRYMVAFGRHVNQATSIISATSCLAGADLAESDSWPNSGTGSFNCAVPVCVCLETRNVRVFV